MRVPVFVSAPSNDNLNPTQRANYGAVIALLEDLNLERRALGRSDYPTELPLREVLQIARRCSGGVILGFAQDVGQVVVRPWKKPVRAPAEKRYPTPWNNLEAGVLFSLGLPLMILREPGISGGVFDHGVTDVFVHDLPATRFRPTQLEQLREAARKWSGRVQQHYYDT